MTIIDSQVKRLNREGHQGFFLSKRMKNYNKFIYFTDIYRNYTHKHL